MFISTDDGRTWLPSNAGLPSPLQVISLAVRGEKLFAGLYSRGGYVSADGGASWKKAGDVKPYCLEVKGKRVFAGHVPGGVFVTEDDGRTWEESNRGLHGDPVIYAIAASGDKVFVGTLDDGVFCSTDDGRS